MAKVVWQEVGVGEQEIGADPEARPSDNRAREAVLIRVACPSDGPAMAVILAEAFPSMYEATFGKLSVEEIARLLTALYAESLLSLETTRIAEREGEVVGLAILHIGKDIGQGKAGDFWRILRGQFGSARAVRAFLGGLATNLFLNRRIPSAADLVYVEALAVGSRVRGQGIGTLLLADSESWARTRARTRLALHVLEKNTGARRLYARIGFRLWNRAGGVPWSEGAEARRASDWSSLLLVRSLSPLPYENQGHP